MISSRRQPVCRRLFAVYLRKNLGLTRFLMHVDVGGVPHRDLLKTIELYGTKVVPLVRKELERLE